MGIWPFNRKNSRKKKTLSSGAAGLPSDNAMDHITDPRKDPKREQYQNRSSGPALERKRSDGSTKKRRSRRASKKLQRDPEKRAYSFSPSRNDIITAPRDANRHNPVPPLPSTYQHQDIENIGSDDEKSGLRTARSTTNGTTILSEIEGNNWQCTPTLHKRSAKDSALTRRKSSKKRKADYDREEEIKAMSSNAHIRPSGQSVSSSQPSKKNSKRLRSGISGRGNNPSSSLSLPLPESIHSMRSTNSDKHASYKLSAIDALSPRPTIKYAENPRYAQGATNMEPAERSDSRRRRVSDRIPITKEVMKAHKCVDDLADDLDAGDLREIMERDQRRRDRKKASDQIKMERRLARRAEKQRLAEQQAAANGTTPPKNMDRGVAGREMMGVDTSTLNSKSSKRKGSDSSEQGRDKRPSEPWREDSTNLHKDPFSDEHRTGSPSGTASTPTDEHEEPEYGTARVARLSRASASMSRPNTREHLRKTSNVSEVLDLRRPAIDATAKPEPSQRDLNPSGRQPGQSWTSFFKRTATKNKGRSATPPSFSNTSRDSIARSSTSVKPPSIGFGLARQISGVPKRTMSKFREDLPELPLSPPDSRVQSPEADTTSPNPVPVRLGEDPFADPVVRRHDTPTSGHRSMDITPEPIAMLSRSLASIDSEGSWLSGRPAGSKRGSIQTPLPHLQDSADSLQRRYKEYADSGEEMGIAEDEYFGRLTPGPDDMLNEGRRISGNPMPSSDEEDNSNDARPSSPETKWHGGIARKPTLIRHENRVKSAVVSLNDFNYEAGNEVASEEPAEPSRKKTSQNNFGPPSAGEIHRATSIDFGKGQGHARHISAGSAKLLDLKPRASIDSKRQSMSRGE